MGFPRQVNVQGAPAVAGDFCDANPRSTVDSGQGAFVAGPLGVIVGAFGWIDATNRVVTNSGPGAPAGFLRRDQQGIITAYLAEATMLVAPGFPVSVFNAGGFWALNSGSATTAIGNKAYANNGNGSVTFGPTGTPPVGASVTGSIAANTTTAGVLAQNSVTGSITGSVLTVTAVGTGLIAAGQTLAGGSSGTGFVDPATTVLSQISGAAGGIGTYQLSVSGAVTSTTITASGGCLTVGGTITGVFAVGQTISGAGVAAGTTITALGSGTGGAGTYAVSVGQTVASVAMTATGGVLTVSAVASGALAVGDAIGGSGVTAGTYITGLITGTGGLGTYAVSASQTATSTTITVAAGTETKWVAASIAAPGELVKMTTWLNG
jgi:hypothetical protein